MSNGLTSSILQDLILAHVSAIQNKNNPRPGGPSSSLLDQSKHLFFIDDLNMAQMIGGKEFLFPIFFFQILIL